jgi:hypothetical protein
MGKLTEAKDVAKKAYECVSVVYNQEHPLALRAARRLIQIFGSTGNYKVAEDYAKKCYETLHSKDPESYETGKAAIIFADAICNLIKATGPGSADIRKAEMLSGKGSTSMRKFKGIDYEENKRPFATLINVALLLKNLSDTLKE